MDHPIRDLGLTQKLRRTEVFSSLYASTYQTVFLEAIEKDNYKEAARQLEIMPKGLNEKEELERLKVLSEGWKYLASRLNEELEIARNPGF